ncbi:cytochrome P450 family protein [Streptomyces ipomoeae]|uniref:cytochrome P450 family protein n=1 Tax=Streptomyces ipomoeae TaxID=103232 RepID=UPI0011470CC4|nr:cytochrome P450 [Streptomyces ipomoeae]MDX2931691.1 cytochrome P450 [Streptomyces ipomoeae]TQE30600.1 cytochrome P450 [Streptomyces ipomoeae]
MRPPTTEPVVLGPDFIEDPHSVHARLREQGPALQAVMSTGLKAWLVTDYEKGRALLADPRLSKNMADAGHLFERHQTDMSRQRDYSHAIQKSMINMNPPDHTRLRGLIGKAFTMRQVKRLRPRIAQIADELLDSLAGRIEFDVITEYAAPLVSMVIAEMLGVPEEHRAEFRAISDVLTFDADRETVDKASNALLVLVSDIVEARRADPDDRLISSLILAADGEDRLSHEEIVSLVVVLFVGGFDTTVNLIGNGTLSLLRNPDQLAVLLADPSLLPNAVEEFLRFEGSANISHFRRTVEPIPVGDVTIPADEFVFVGLLSANRDPDPDRLDVTRSEAGHIAFGHGIHHCVGAPLARAEGEIAFGRLLDRFPSLGLAIDPSELMWRPSMLHRGVRSLPVRAESR